MRRVVEIYLRLMSWEARPRLEPQLKVKLVEVVEVDSEVEGVIEVIEVEEVEVVRFFIIVVTMIN
jgi:hypothetical protein